jgi:hypothetical protein
MKLVKTIVLFTAVFLIAGMAFFQLVLILTSLVLARKIYLQHNPRQCGLTPT